MNKALRLALLLGLASLAAWSSAARPAFALPLCDGLDGSFCSVPGKTIPCLWREGGSGACRCEDQHWNCG